MTLTSNGEWDWRAGTPIKSLQSLVALHDASVGHNANLLLNCGPSYSGLLPPEDMARYKEFGDWVSSCYGSPVNITAGPLAAASGDSATLELHADAPPLGRIWLMEGQSGGQRIRSFSVEVRNRTGAAWSPLLAGAQSIGHKRILVLVG